MFEKRSLTHRLNIVELNNDDNDTNANVDNGK